MLSSLYAQKMRCSPYGGFDKTLAITTAGVTQDVLAPKVAGLTLNVQKIKVTVSTGAAFTWQLRAKTTTALKLTGVLSMATTGTTFEFDFGPKGFALPAGETLEVDISGAGAAGRIEVEGRYS